MPTKDNENVGVVQGAINYSDTNPRRNVFSTVNPNVYSTTLRKPDERTAPNPQPVAQYNNTMAMRDQAQKANNIQMAQKAEEEANAIQQNNAQQSVVNNANAHTPINTTYPQPNLNASFVQGPSEATLNPTLRQNPIAQSAIKKETPTQEVVKQPQTWEEMRDYLYGSEAEKEKEANRKAKIQAVGDALRHIGNLATVSWGGATPQQYKTSPAQATLDQYKTERKERDAMGYQHWTALQKQKQQEIENELARQKNARENATAEANLYYKDAQTKKILQDMKFNAEKYPYEYQKLAGEAAYAIANGQTKEFEAAIKKLELDNTPTALKLANDLKKAQTNSANASAASSWANASFTKAKEKELRDTAKERNYFTIPTSDPKKVWSIPKSQYGVLGKALAGEAAKHSDWKQNLKDVYGGEKNMTNEDWLIEAYKHLDDNGIQTLLSKYGTLSDPSTNPYEAHSYGNDK